MVYDHQNEVIEKLLVNKLPRALADSDARSISDLLDQWETLDQMLNLPRHVALGICKKKLHPNRAAPLLDIFDRVHRLGVGFDVAMQNKTLLSHACAVGNLPAAKFLLARGVNPNQVAQDSTSNKTPLHYASIGHEKVMALLIRSGADVGATTDNGKTPLLCSIESGQAAMGCIQQLLAAGADVSVCDNDNRNALHTLAMHYGNWPDHAKLRQVCIDLIVRGVNPEHPQDDGNSFLDGLFFIGQSSHECLRDAFAEATVILDARKLDEASPLATARKIRRSL